MPLYATTAGGRYAPFFRANSLAEARELFARFRRTITRQMGRRPHWGELIEVSQEDFNLQTAKGYDFAVQNESSEDASIRAARMARIPIASSAVGREHEIRIARAEKARGAAIARLFK